MQISAKLSKRMISMLLLFSLLFAVCACTGAEMTTTGITTTQPVTEPDNSFELTEDFMIIYANRISDEEYFAVTKLQKGILSALGIKISAYSENYASSLDELPESLILVGDIERSESKELTDTLTYSDYAYEIKSDKIIIISGGSPAAVNKGVLAFLKDNFGCELDESTSEIISAGIAKKLKSGTNFVFNSIYPSEKIDFLDFDINDFVIISTNLNSKYAKDISAFFSTLNGARLQIITPNMYKSDMPAIFIGLHYDSNVLIDNYAYYITKEIKDGVPVICINGGSSQLLTEAVNYFLDNYLKVAEIKAEISIKFEDLNITNYDIPGQINGLVLEKQTETQVATGITYYEKTYKDKNGSPVIAYILSVESGCGSFYMGTAGNAVLNTVKNSSGTLTNQMTSAKVSGKNVIAGVNADFYDMSVIVPRGLTIRDGVVMHDTGNRPWFGILSDGTPVIGSANDYNRYSTTLDTAVGGSNIVLINGKLTNLGVGTEFGDTRHPRTAVGITADGTVILLAIDGRQKSFSNGASLAEVGFMLREMGCIQGLNLDGGGSTTIAIAENDIFTVKNKPSDGTQRFVCNTLLVLAP